MCLPLYFFSILAHTFTLVNTRQIQTACKLGIMTLPFCSSVWISSSRPLSHNRGRIQKHTGPRETWKCVKEGIARSFSPCLNLGRAKIHHRIKPVSHQTQESVANAISLSHCLTWLHVGWERMLKHHWGLDGCHCVSEWEHMVFLWFCLILFVLGLLCHYASHRLVCKCTYTHTYVSVLL